MNMTSNNAAAEIIIGSMTDANAIESSIAAVNPGQTVRVQVNPGRTYAIAQHGEVVQDLLVEEVGSDLFVTPPNGATVIFGDFVTLCDQGKCALITEDSAHADSAMAMAMDDEAEAEADRQESMSDDEVSTATDGNAEAYQGEDAEMMAATESTDGADSEAQNSDEEDDEEGDTPWLYTGLGLLAAGGIAAGLDDDDGLGPNDLQHLTAAEISLLQPDFFLDVQGSDLEKIDASQAGGLTTGQILVLANTGALNSLTAAAAAGLSAGSLAELSAAQIAALPVGLTSALAPNVMASLSAAQFAALTPDQISAVTVAQTAALSADHVAAITSQQAAAFSADHVAGLNGAGLLNDLSESSKSALSPHTFSTHSAAQITALSTDIVKALSPSNLASFTPTQVTAMSPEQMSALTAAQVGALTAEQVLALTSQQINALANAGLIDQLASATAAVLFGSISAGPVIAGNGLLVEVFDRDGNKLAEGDVTDTGAYRIALVTAYTGPVIVRVVDQNAANDYLDEATSAGKDLNSDLRAVFVVEGSGEFIVNVNSATEIAALAMGLTGGADGTSSVTLGDDVDNAGVSATNNSVAMALGLVDEDNLLRGEIVTTIVANDSGQAVANPAGSNTYGDLLAAISGIESVTGDTTVAVHADLANGIDGSALIGAIQSQLVSGGVAGGANIANLIQELNLNAAVNLTADQFAALTPAQIAALPADSLDNLTVAQVAALPASVIGNLAPDTLASLSADQVAAVTAEQAAALTADQVAALAAAGLLDDLAAAAVAELSVESLNNLTADQVAALTAEQAAALTADQVAALAAAGLLDDLAAAAVAALSVDSLDNLTAAQVAALPASVIANLAPDTLASLSADQVAALTVEQVAALTADQVAALATAGLLADLADAAEAALSVDSLDNLTVAQVAALPASVIANLAPDTLASLSADQVAALTAEQAAALTADQVAALATAGLLADLSDAAEAALSVDSLDNLTVAQVAALPASVIANLAPDTLASLSAAQVAFLTAEQAAALTADQVAALATAGLLDDLADAAEAALSVDSLDNLTVSQVAALPASVIANLAPDTLASLSAAQVAALTAEQAAALTADQVAALATAGLLADLSDAAVAALSVDSLDNLTVAQVAALPASVIANLAPDTLASLSTDQVAALTAEQAAVLTADQVAALATAGLLDDLSDAAEAALSVDSLDNLTVAQVAALPASVIANLAPDTLASLSAAQVAALTAEQAAALTADQVAALATAGLLDDLADAPEAALSEDSLDNLTVAQVAALPASVIANLAPDTLASLSADQVAALTAEQAAALTADQVAALATAGLLDDLSDAAEAALSVDSLDNLTVAQVAALPASVIANLAPDTLASLSADQVAALTAEQAAALTADQVAALATAGLLDDLSDAAEAALSVDSLDNLTVAQVAALPASVIANLAPDTLASLSAAQVAALTVEQVAALTAAQVAALTAEQAAALTADQVAALATAGLLDDLAATAVAALSVDSLDNLTAVQVAALPASVIANLAPDTLASLSAAQVAALEAEQVAALTVDQITALSAEQVGALSADQFSNFTPAQVGAISPASLAQVTPDTLATLTAEQLAAITAEQLAAMTPEQIQAISPDSVLTIQVDPISGDNVVDQTEALSDLTISGDIASAEGVTAIVVSLGGQEYTATLVDTSWTVDVPSADLQALAEGTNQVIVRAKDSSAVLSQSVANFAVFAAQPMISIDAVSTDNVITIAESKSDISLSGTTVNIEDGQIVTLSLNGKTYTATVVSGAWNTLLPTADAETLASGDNTLTADVSTVGGVPATQASLTVNFADTAPSIAIDVVATDNIISGSEDDSDITISGTTANVEDGQNVFVTLGSNGYQGTVSNNTWSITMPAIDAQALTEGVKTIYADVADLAGTPAEQAALDITHDTTAVISFDAVAVDNIISPEERDGDLTLTGRVLGIEDGQIITITLADSSPTDVTPAGGITAVVANGAWSAILTAVQLQALPADNISIEASATDLNGNMAVNTQSILNDVPALTIVLDDVDLGIGDTAEVTFTFATAPADFDSDHVAVENGTLTINETADGSRTVFTGTYTPDAIVDAENVLKVTLDGSGQPVLALASFAEADQSSVTYDGITLGAAALGWGNSGAFSSEFIAGDGSVTAKVGVVNNNNSMLGLSVNNPDDSFTSIEYAIFILNGSFRVYESGSSVFTGAAGSVAEGDILSIVRTGTTIEYYNLTQDAVNPMYTSAAVSTGDLHVDVAFNASNASYANIILSDNASPTAAQSDITAAAIVSSDNYALTTVVPAVTIDNISSDNTIDATEAESDTVITGTTQGVEAGQLVSLVIPDPSGDKSYQALVQPDGSWSVTLPSAVAMILDDVNPHTVTADVENAAGQSATQATQTLTIDNTSALTIVLDDVDLGIGDTAEVTFTFATAPADFDSDHVAVENGTLTINETADGSRTVFTGTYTPDAIVDAENVLKVTLDGSGQPVLALASFAEADQSSVTYDGITLGAAASGWGNSGAFSSEFIAGDGSVTAKVGVVNNNNSMLGLSVNNPDDSFTSIEYAIFILNGSFRVYESGSSVFTGAAGSVAEGDILSIVRTGTTIEYYNLTQDAVNPMYTSAAVSTGDLHVDVAFNASNASYANIIFSDNASPTAAQSDITAAAIVSSDNYALTTVVPAVTIDNISSDNTIDATEAESDTVITGTTQGVEAGQLVSLVIPDPSGDKSYQALVQPDGSWSVTLPSAVAMILDDVNPHTVTADVENAAGQSATQATQTLTIDNTSALTIVLDDVDLGIGDTAEVTFTFATAPADFDSDHVAVENGTLTINETADGSRTVFTGTYTPDAIVDAENVLKVTLDGSGQPVLALASFAEADQSSVTYDGITLGAAASGWGNSGAFSSEFIAGDGSVTAKVGVVNNNNSMLGLSVNNPDDSFTSIEYAIFIHNGSFGVYESGSSVFTGAAGSVAEGDILSIVRTGTTIEYYNLTQDAVNPMYTSAAVSTGDLHVDVAFNASNASYANIIFSDNASPTAAQSDITAAAIVSSDNYALTTVVPAVTIDNISSDNTIDATEALVITGSTVGITDGTTMQLTLNGIGYLAQVDKGFWAVEISAIDISALADGSNSLSVTVTPEIGDAVTATRDFDYDSTEIVTITIDSANIAASGNAVVTFTFKEAVSGFDVADINVPNGTLSGLASSDGGVAWTATFNPSADRIALPDFISIGSGWTYTASGEAPTSVPGIELPLFDNEIIAPNNTVSFNGRDSRTTSAQSIGGDGGVSTFVAETHTSRTIGLATDNDANKGTALYALRLNNDGTLDIVEDGAVIEAFGEDVVYQTGDKLSIERYNDTLLYRQNGEVIYVSEQLNSGVLYIDVSSSEDGATLQNVVINRYVGSTTTAYRVNTTTPEVDIDAISTDDVIRVGESFEITGTTTNVEEGQIVAVSLNGEIYEALVAAGTWSVAVPSADAQSLSDGNIAVTADVSNAVGTPATASSTFTYTAAPAVTLVLDDSFVAAGETATLTITFDQAVVGLDLDALTVANGFLSDMTSADGGVTWTATYSPSTSVDEADNLISLNQVGAPFYFSNGQQVQVSSFVDELDADGQPTGELLQQDRVDSNAYTVSTSTPIISVDLVAEDNTLSAHESVNGFVITGSAFGVADGQILSLTLNSQTYQGEVQNGVWQITVPQADAATLSAGAVSYTATVDNLSGTTANASGSFANDAVDPLVITLDDSALAAGESATVTFTFRADVENFDLGDVSVSNGSLSSFVGSGSVYTATLTPDSDTASSNNLVEVGSGWSFVDGTVTAASTSTQATFAVASNVQIDANNLTKTSTEANNWNAGTFSNEVISGRGSVTTTVAETDTARMIGLSAQDDNTNYSTIDFALYLAANGTLSVYENGVLLIGVGSYQTGDEVSVERSGAQISYLRNGVMLYSSDVISTGDLHVDTSLFSNGATLNNIVIDNGKTAVSSNYEVLTATPTITIDAVAADNAIDGVEVARDQLVTGTASGIVEGETIAVSLNGNVYSAVVQGGTWATVVPAANLAAGNLTASHTNSIGVTANATQAITVGAVPVAITVDDAALNTGETATVTFTFTEAVENFGQDDIQVSSGTLSNLQSSDGSVTWTAELTPEEGVNVTTNAISVGNTWTYVSGNPVPVTGTEFGVSFAGNFDGTTTEVNGNNVVKIGVSGWASNAIGTDSVANIDTDSAAFSNQAIKGNGYLSTTLGDDDGTKAIGLSTQNANDSYLSMDYAVVYTAGGALSFYQNGSLQISSSVTAASGDTLNIHVNSGVVSVSVNGTSVHTFTKAATGAPLYADIALNTVGAAFNNIVMSDDAVAASDNYAVNTELTVENASVAANTVTITYSSTLSALSVPPTNAFEVMVDGAGRVVTGTAVNGNQLVLTFGGDAVIDTNQVEFSYTATGSSKVQDLFGGLADNLENVVVANGNLNVLRGGASNDLIVGTSGANALIGNAGDDLLLGNSGADIFEFNNLVGGVGTDTILDFNLAEGDSIYLSDVLVGYTAGDDLSDYIRVDTYSDTDDRIVLKIDTDGVGDVNNDPFNPNLTIILDNVTAADVNLSTYVDDLNTGGGLVVM